jgi:hypothetical protein
MVSSLLSRRGKSRSNAWYLYIGVSISLWVFAQYRKCAFRWSIVPRLMTNILLRRNNRITMDAEHEQPNTTKLDNTYTIYDDYDDEHSNTIDTQEQHTTRQHYEDDKNSVVTENDIDNDMFEPVTDDKPPPHNVDHAPPSTIVRRSSRSRFPTSRFTYRAHAAITKHFQTCSQSRNRQNRQFYGTNTDRPTTTNT